VILDISDPTKIEQLGYGIMPDRWSFFPNRTDNSVTQGYHVSGDYLYWSINNELFNQPVIEMIKLP
jgi:hypothetical protein